MEKSGPATLRYTMHKKSILFKGHEATLAIVRDFTPVENLQRKIAEGKYRAVLLSTITHDIKTPLTVILGNLSLLGPHVMRQGRDFFTAVSVATETLEFFMRDIIVSGPIITRSVGDRT